MCNKQSERQAGSSWTDQPSNQRTNERTNQPTNQTNRRTGRQIERHTYVHAGRLAGITRQADSWAGSQSSRRNAHTKATRLHATAVRFPYHPRHFPSFPHTRRRCQPSRLPDPDIPKAFNMAPIPFVVVPVNILCCHLHCHFLFFVYVRHFPTPAPAPTSNCPSLSYTSHWLHPVVVVVVVGIYSATALLLSAVIAIFCTFALCFVPPVLAPFADMVFIHLPAVHTLQQTHCATIDSIDNIICNVD